jgi:uncharacterized protein YmfQ (DUF2313 family)
MDLSLVKNYKDLLKSLLPKGQIWHVEEGTELDKIFEIVANGLWEVDVRSRCLLKEAWPTSATEMLPEWIEFLKLDLQAPLLSQINLNRLADFHLFEKLPYSKSAMIEYCNILGYKVASIDLSQGLQSAEDLKERMTTLCVFTVSAVPHLITDTPLITQTRNKQFEKIMGKRMPASILAKFVYN